MRKHNHGPGPRLGCSGPFWVYGASFPFIGRTEVHVVSSWSCQRLLWLLSAGVQGCSGLTHCCQRESVLSQAPTPRNTLFAVGFCLYSLPARALFPAEPADPAACLQPRAGFVSPPRLHRAALVALVWICGRGQRGVGKEQVFAYSAGLAIPLGKSCSIPGH